MGHVGRTRGHSRGGEAKAAVSSWAPYREHVEGVKQMLKQGDFFPRDVLLKRVSRLLKDVSSREQSLRAADEFLYLKSMNIASEVFDYFGYIEEAREAVKDGADVLARLPTLVDARTSKADRRLIRERIRYCLDYAQAFHYRAHNYPEAKRIISRCRSLIFSGLRVEERNAFPCHGTLAQLSYYLGRVHRQMNEYEEAEECFAQAISYYYRRAMCKKAELRHKPELVERELSFAQYKSSVVLSLGLGWLHYTRGHLIQTLRNNILPARVMLAHTRDELNKAYVELLYGATMRSVGGTTDTKKLREALSSIARAHRVFEQGGHRTYQARADYELALVNLQLGLPKEALLSLREVEKTSRKAGDRRWLSKSKVLLSRIECTRGRYEKAVKEASAALALADEPPEQVGCKIDALITRGEMMIMLGNYEGAREDLNAALALNKSYDARGTRRANPSDAALCILFIAKSYGLGASGDLARDYYDRWEKLKDDVEHRIIHELGEDIGRMIAEKSFNIPANLENLNYSECQIKLQRWLIETAQLKLETTNASKIAGAIGVGRGTVFNWMKKFRDESRKKAKMSQQ